MENLRTLLINFPGEIDRVKHDIENVYLPTVNLLNYSLSPSGTQITLYTHAPINLDILEQLAKDFSVEYKAESARELAGTIDRINAKVLERGGLVPVYQFAREHNAKGRELTKLQASLDTEYANFLASIASTHPELHRQLSVYKAEDLLAAYASSDRRIVGPLNPVIVALAPTINAYRAYVVANHEYLHACEIVQANPLFKIIWNRDALILPTTVGHDSIHFVHGHVGPGQHIRENASNLDSHFGRSAENMPKSTGIEPVVELNDPAGAYCIHVTEGHSPMLVMAKKGEGAGTQAPPGGSPTPDATLPPDVTGGHAVVPTNLSAGTGVAVSTPGEVAPGETSDESDLRRTHPYRNLSLDCLIADSLTDDEAGDNENSSHTLGD